MTRKPRPSPPPSRANLTDAEKRAAIPRLADRVKELLALEIRTIRSGSDPRITGLETRIEQTLAGIYGPETHDYETFISASNLKPVFRGPLYIGVGPQPPGPNTVEIQAAITRRRDNAVTILSEAARILREELDALPVTPPSPVPTGRQISTAIGSEIFVVHGKDDPAKDALCLLLTRAGLRPIVLHEQANEGRTIIEKFEHHAETSGFAVVLLTPDDEGGPAGGTVRPRARQNVIGEMFWFAGRLGRQRVCALRKGDIEIPTDFAGVVYTDMDERGAWRAELLKELTAAGYSVDWGKALA